MTTFQNFVEKIKKGVENHYGEACRISLSEVKKNNGMIYHGITIGEKGKSIMPTVYLDGFYQDYENGMPLSDVLETVISLYEKHKIEKDINLDFLTEYSWAKERILYKLISYENNRELLQEVPHVRFLDMAMVFYCDIDELEIGRATFLIKNNICEKWDVDTAHLLALAKENTPRVLPGRIMGMHQIVEEMQREYGVVKEGEDTCDSTGLWIENKHALPQMYVLTNEQKMYGAGCILYPDILKKFSDKVQRNLFILPSSVHEVILVPDCPEFSVRQFEKTVREINRTQLMWEEVLSDSVYYYDRSCDEIHQM